MSQAAEGADTAARAKIWKIHNVSKDAILGGRRVRREAGGARRRLHTQQREEEPSVQRTQMILKKYIPIKQKFCVPPPSVGSETKTSPEHHPAHPLHPAPPPPECPGKILSDESSLNPGLKGGLRLRNISALLKEPDKDIQDSPLDLSRKCVEDAASSSSSSSFPLDLSLRSDQDTRVPCPAPPTLPAPAPSSEVTSTSGGCPHQAPVQPPVQFVILDSKSILRHPPLNPHNMVIRAKSVTETNLPRRPTLSPPSSSVPPVLNTKLAEDKTVLSCSPLLLHHPSPISSVVPSPGASSSSSSSPSSSSSSPVASMSTVSPSIVNLKSDPDPGSSQVPIQMLFYNGNLVQVLPQKMNANNANAHHKNKLENVHKTNVRGGKKDAGINQVALIRQHGEEKRRNESMIKTNETVTKNGDLFCTFKNVKQMKLLKQQQSRKVRQKKS